MKMNGEECTLFENPKFFSDFIFENFKNFMVEIQNLTSFTFFGNFRLAENLMISEQCVMVRQCRKEKEWSFTIALL